MPGHAFFVEMGLFICPIALDAFGYRPDRRLRRRVNTGIRGVSIGVLVLVIMGLGGLFTIQRSRAYYLVLAMPRNTFAGFPGFEVAQHWFWLACVVPPIVLTVADWLGREKPHEKEVVSAVQLGGETQ